MATTAKKYDTSYKKKTDTDRDSYLPSRSPKEMRQCAGCAAFYHRRHWSLTKSHGFDFSVRVHPCYCPACRKIKDHRASAELDLVSFNKVKNKTSYASYAMKKCVLAKKSFGADHED